MLSCSIWFSVPSFWMGGGLEKTMCCNSTSNAPDDGRMYLKICRAKNISIKLPCCIKLAFQIITLIKFGVKNASENSPKSTDRKISSAAGLRESHHSSSETKN